MILQPVPRREKGRTSAPTVPHFVQTIRGIQRRRAGYSPTRPIGAGTLHPAGYWLRSSSTTSAGSCTRSAVLSTAVGRGARAGSASGRPGVLGRRRVLDRERKTMNTNWIRAALADRGLQAKDLAKRWGVTDAVASRFINEGDPELTWDRAVLLARLLDLDLNQLHAKLGSVSGKSEFTWFHAEFVAQRLGMDMKQLHEKIGGGPINW
jgi:hypothetical protein